MVPKHYENMREASLFEYITPDIVRTVLESQRDIPCGFSEIPLEIHLKKKAIKRLSFSVSWDGILYGFVRGKEALRVRAGLSLPIKAATLSDWDAQFALVLETEDAGHTAAFCVRTDDVIYLLENCMRVPEQRIKK